MTMVITSTVAFSKDKKRTRKYTGTQLKAKFDRLNTSVNRVIELKKRGHMPKAIEEANYTVEIAEEEFGVTSISVLKPLLTLAELFGKQRRYEEAEKSLEKIYIIIESGEDVTSIYAIGYRIKIARLYIQWNKFDEAESTLMTAQNIIKISELKSARDSTIRIKSTYRPFANFTRSINTELEKVHDLQEINRYNIKKKK